MGEADDSASGVHWIVGAGAVGLALGTALLGAGERVAFLARAARARALRETGCAREGVLGSACFGPEAFDVLEAPGPSTAAPRSVLVATKAPAVPAVARALAEWPAVARSRAPVVGFRNGLGSAEALAAHLEAPRVFSARVITGFRCSAPTRVDVTVHADAIHVGSLFGADLAPVEPLVRALSRGGLPAETTPDVARDLWAKLLYNTVLNPLGAILGVPYGALGEREETREIIAAVAREGFAVMEAEGVSIGWPDADAWLAHFHDTLLPATARHESSMLQDVRAGRPTEIDALCGEVVRRGARHGVEAPVNETLLRLVRALGPP